MRPADLARAAAGALLDLVYPPRCAACGEPAPEGGPFCGVCAEAVDPVPAGCGRCGLPGPDSLCGACRARAPAFDAVRAGGLFGGPLAEAIHALKYGGRPALARPLGRWLASVAPPAPGVLVVSVPLARGRRIERGYDQAALLADRYAGAAPGRPPRARGALARTRETRAQVGLSREERARNVADAFAATPGVRGRDVVLIDDVVTTGATADAASLALRRAGARSIVVVALARAE
jgi:ComF family protein